jgi:hypothetical protein
LETKQTIGFKKLHKVTKERPLRLSESHLFVKLKTHTHIHAVGVAMFGALGMPLPPLAAQPPADGAVTCATAYNSKDVSCI